MLKLGIIGSDNSHAIAYSKLANIDHLLGERARVVAITGRDPERTREVAELGQIVEIAENPEQLAARVDAVIVVDRHGDLHRDHALAAIRAGKPVYVDKPLAIKIRDALAIINAAREPGVALTSFSSLRVTPTTLELANDVAGIGDVRHGQFTGPCDFSSEYGGPFFYATHALEIACRVLGDDLATVRASREGNTVTVNLRWASGITGTIDYLANAGSTFHGTVVGKSGAASKTLLAGDVSYGAALGTIVTMFETGQTPLSPSQMLTPLVAIHGIQESLTTGQTITLEIEGITS